MKEKEIYQDILKDIKLMQLATCRDNQPWLCNVWYVMDEDENIYWNSRLTRRHSEEIADNPRVACTFHKWFNEGIGQKGQALIVSGNAELLSGEDIRMPYKLYVGRNPKFLDVQSLETTMSATGPHFFYKLTPDEIIWWDEVNFPDNPRRVVKT